MKTAPAAMRGRWARMVMLLGGMALAALAWRATWAGPVADLRKARQEAAMLALVQHSTAPAPPLLLPRADLFAGSDEATAGAALRQRLRSAAVRHGLLVERLGAAGTVPDPMVGVRLQLSGREAQITRFLADIEGGRPVVRFTDWTLKAIGDRDSVRFEGTAAGLRVSAP